DYFPVVTRRSCVFVDLHEVVHALFGKPDGEDNTTALAIFTRHGAAVAVDDDVEARCETVTRPASGRVRRGERLEQVLANRLGDPQAVVFDPDFYVPFLTARPNPDVRDVGRVEAFRTAQDRLEGVVEQAQYDVRHLPGDDVDGPDRWVEFALDLDEPLPLFHPKSALRDRQAIGYEHVEVGRPAFSRASLCVLKHPFQDDVGALAVVVDLVAGLPDF